MAIKRERVSSTCLRSVGHDKESKRLEVEFRKGGAVYAYDGVSSRAASNLKNASSIGRHFVRNVRDRYDYTRLRARRSQRHAKRRR